MQSDAGSLVSGDGERILIGCAPDLSLHRVQALLGALYRSHPRLRTEVVHLRCEEQLRRLRADELQLGLIHDLGPQPDVETASMAPGEPLCAFLPVGHPLTALDVLGAGDLESEVHVRSPRAADPALSDRLDALLEGAGHRFAAVHETVGTEPRDVILVVAELRGAAVGPESLLRISGELDTIVTSCALDPPLQMPETMLAWHARPAGVDGIVAAAREAAQLLRRSF
jgi:hypothetical protein